MSYHRPSSPQQSSTLQGESIELPLSAPEGTYADALLKIYGQGQRREKRKCQASLVQRRSDNVQCCSSSRSRRQSSTKTWTSFGTIKSQPSNGGEGYLSPLRTTSSSTTVSFFAYISTQASRLEVARLGAGFLSPGNNYKERRSRAGNLCGSELHMTRSEALCAAATCIGPHIWSLRVSWQG